MSGEETLPERPVLRLVRGTPSPDELAALVAVVVAAGSAAEAGRRHPRPASQGWASHERTVRGALPGGGWRSSGSPR